MAPSVEIVETPGGPQLVWPTVRRTHVRAILGTLLVAALALAGCGGDGSIATDPEPTPVMTPAAPTAPTSATPAPTGSAGRGILDDFPLQIGLPRDDEAEPGDHGLTGPDRTMVPIVPEACGTRVPLPRHTDWLRVEWSNPEDYRERQLLTFADVDEAQAYAEQVLELFRTCPEEVTSEEVDETRHTTVARTDLGDWSGAASALYRQQGYPAPGLTTWYVVRVGAAVLVSVTYNEGGAGPDPERDAADQRRVDARSITEVVDAMHTLEAFPSEPPFGPNGFGQVTIGMSREALLAIPGVRVTGSNGVCEDFDAPGVRGHLQPGLGVAVLLAEGDLETPEGIHLGSTLAEVRAAYPHGTYDDPWYSAPPYVFERGDGDRVISVMLLHDDQHCGS